MALPSPETLYRMYWIEEKSCIDIGKELGLKDYQVHYLLKKYGILRRNYKQARTLFVKKGYNKRISEGMKKRNERRIREMMKRIEEKSLQHPHRSTCLESRKRKKPEYQSDLRKSLKNSSSAEGR